jgi:hypothetical protein
MNQINKINILNVLLYPFRDTFKRINRAVIMNQLCYQIRDILPGKYLQGLGDLS